MPYIPQRFRAECFFCHDPIDTRTAGVCQWGEGWIENRSGGGAHGVRGLKRYPRFACKWCVDKVAGKANAGQLELFS